MVSYRVGYCCCNTTEFKSVSMLFSHTPGNPSTNPVTSATLTLFYYAANTTHAEDITFDVDISPLNGKTVPEMWDKDWTLKLLIDGEEAGAVRYNYVSGSSYLDFLVNLSVDFAGYTYTAEGCTANESMMGGLGILRHACTRSPIH